MPSEANPQRSPDHAGFSLGTQWMLATACGLLVANLYYAQSLTGLIAASLGMPPGMAGLLVILPLAGYGIGLLLIVPLGDLVESRGLVLTLVGLEALCTAGISQITRPAAFRAYGGASEGRESYGGLAPRQLRETTGLAPHQWLTRRRVQRARELLAQTTMDLADIALACGFVDQSHFSRVFARTEKQSPGRWRRQLAT